MTPRLLIAGMSVLMLSGCTSGAGDARAAERPPRVATTVAESVPTDAPSAEAIAEEQVPAVADAATQPSAQERAEASDPKSQTADEAVRKMDETVQATASVKADPVAPATTLLDRFDAQLIALTQNDASADDAFSPLPADERELLTTVVDSLARFRVALGNPQGLLRDKAAPMIDLAQELNAQAPLTLPTVALCRSVTQFGVYDPFEPPRFPAGRDTHTIVYCEVEHFRSAPASQGGFQTKLTYEAVLYSDADHAVSVISKKPASIVDICRNRRRDFFLADRLTLPATLPVGRYLLKVTVVDQLANRVAEKTVPIVIAAE